MALPERSRQDVEAHSSHTVTGLLARWRAGNVTALDELMPIVYADLKRLAGRCLRRERAGHTLETRDLIHETFFRLLGQRDVQWQNRSHFFAIAARMMRRILVDHGRRRRSLKRGGHLHPITLGAAYRALDGCPVDVLALHEALEALERADPTLARIVELRFFAGLEHDEVAAILDVSNATVRRRWRMAKAWLYRRLTEQGTVSAGH